MTDTTKPIAPIRKLVTVRVPPARAFQIFTNEIGSWWPLATHSVGLERAVAVSLASTVGGELVETMADNTVSVWGTVLRYNPPHELALTWHPGRSAESATLLEITFRAVACGNTEVELVHSGWERWENGGPIAANYREGWGAVLSCFTTRADEFGISFARRLQHTE